MHLIGALPLLGVQLNAVSLVNLTMVSRSSPQLDIRGPDPAAEDGLTCAHPAAGVSTHGCTFNTSMQ